MKRVKCLRLMWLVWIMKGAALSGGWERLCSFTMRFRGSGLLAVLFRQTSVSMWQMLWKFCVRRDIGRMHHARIMGSVAAAPCSILNFRRRCRLSRGWWKSNVRGSARYRPIRFWHRFTVCRGIIVNAAGWALK